MKRTFRFVGLLSFFALFFYLAVGLGWADGRSYAGGIAADGDGGGVARINDRHGDDFNPGGFRSAGDAGMASR